MYARSNRSVSSELEQRVADIRELLRSKKERLADITALKTWRHTDGTVPPERCSRLHESWNTATIRFSWPPLESAKTFFRRIQLPSHYMGIDLRGSAANLEMCLLIGSKIYIDGREVYAVDYWADTKVVPLPLTDSIAGGEEYEIVVHCRQGDGFGYFHDADLRIEAIERWIFTLDMLAEELRFALFLIQSGEAAPEMSDAMMEALRTFRTEPLEQNDWAGAQNEIDTLRAKLELFEPLTKRYRIHLVGHAHIDMNWLWPWSETEDLIRRDFESVDRLMEQYPQIRFSHSQAATYRAMQIRYPELWERVKRRIREGRWDVTASTWVEGDLNMAGWETMARQFLEGKTYCREQLGADPEICWEPDTFGHPATMPKILRQAGIKYYYFCRAGRGVPLFWWEGEDGSRILAFNDPRHYNGKIFASEIVPGSIEMAEQYGLKSSMYVFGVGDHGGGVTRQDIERGIALGESKLLPQILFSESTAFYKDVENSGKPLPVIRGEWNPAFEGCYTSHGDIKKANRETEHALVRAEILNAVADAFRMDAANAEIRPGGAGHDALREPWRTQCFNQFHDILCGCAIHATYQDAIPASGQAKKAADDLSADAVRRMNLLAPHSGGSTAVVVFNTLSWTRTDVVVLRQADYPEIAEWQTGDQLVDADGHAVMLQKSNDTVLFVAGSVPPLGFKAYTYVRNRGGKQPPEREAPAVQTASAGPVTLENEEYRMVLHPHSGAAISLKNKKTEQEFAKPGGFNLFEVHMEAPHGMSAWNIGPIAHIHRLVRGAQVTPGEAGPVMQSAYVTHTFDQSVIRQEIRMYSGLNRIDFIHRIDWLETGGPTSDAAMLKAVFATNLESKETVFDVPFGSVSRYPDGREVPALHWVDLSEGSEDGTRGITFINNGKYGHSVLGSAYALTLLRSSYEPDNRPDVGKHEFTVSVLPHASDWRPGRGDREAWGVQQPLLAVVGERLAGTPDAYSAMQVEELREGRWREAAGVLLTAWKPSRDHTPERPEWIVRLVETHGRSARIRLRFSCPVLFAEEANLVEDRVKPIPPAQINGNQVDLGTVDAGRIVTLRVRPASASKYQETE